MSNYNRNDIELIAEVHGPLGEVEEPQSCECDCGCGEAATQVEQGTHLCDECAIYTVTEDGDVLCARAVCPTCHEDAVEASLDSGGNDDVRVRSCACLREAEATEEDEVPEGEWAVVDMDGQTLSRHASQEGAEAAIAHEVARFGDHLTDTRQASSGAYLPRSVIHLPCGCERAGTYSTSWYSPGCTHRTDVQGE
jgi:hypothetical protein